MNVTNSTCIILNVEDSISMVYCKSLVNKGPDKGQCINVTNSTSIILNVEDSISTANLKSIKDLIKGNALSYGFVPKDFLEIKTFFGNAVKSFALLNYRRVIWGGYD